MKKISVYLLVLLSCLNRPGLAQENQSTTTSSTTTTTTTTTQKAPSHDMEEPFEEGNSLENRRNRTMQLSLGPGIEFGMPIVSYTAGYFLKQNAVLTARYSERHDYTGDTGRKGITAARLGYKKFTGNSFYYQPSLYFRNASHVTTVHYKYKDAGVGLRIGNEWQWENFMLGIDWLGINHSVVELDESVYPGATVPSSIDIDKKFTFDFVGIYLGYTF